MQSKMSIRLRELRKALGYTQVQFSEYIGITQGTLTRMESADKDFNERQIKSICSICKVNEEWFRTGKGSMFEQPETDVIDQLAAEYNLTYIGRKIIETYLNLSHDQQHAVDEFLKTFVTSCARDLDKTIAYRSDKDKDN